MEYDLNIPDILKPREQGPAEPAADPVPVELTEEDKSALARMAASLNQPPKIMDPEQGSQERELKLFSQWQNNLGAAAIMKSEILTGLSQGDSIYPLFLTAIEALAALTGDDAYHTRVAKTVPAVYGEVLQEAYLLDQDLAEVERKIKRANEAINRDTLPPGRISIIRKNRDALLERREYLRSKLGITDAAVDYENAEPAAKPAKKVRANQAADGARWRIERALTDGINPYEALLSTLEYMIPYAADPDNYSAAHKEYSKLYMPDGEDLQSLRLYLATVDHRLEMLKKKEAKLLRFIEDRGYSLITYTYALGDQNVSAANAEIVDELHKIQYAITRHEQHIKEIKKKLAPLDPE